MQIAGVTQLEECLGGGVVQLSSCHASGATLLCV